MRTGIRVAFHAWIASWLDVICGLISVLTLTIYRPWWDFEYRIYTTKKALKRERARRKEV